MPYRESSSNPASTPRHRAGTKSLGRLSEGRRIDELWSQFTADARASYGFYKKDVDVDEIAKLRDGTGRYTSARAMFYRQCFTN